MLSQLDTALYNLLTTDSNLQALVDDRIFAQQAPAAVTLPYVIFRWSQGGYVENSPRLTLDTIYQIEGVATERALALSIAETCHAILITQSLSLTDWSHFATTAQDWHSQVSLEEGINFYQIGASYRIRADKN